MRQSSILWQGAFIEAMKLYRSDVIDVAFVAADSLQVRHVTITHLQVNSLVVVVVVVVVAAAAVVDII